MPTPLQLNLELKARCADLTQARAAGERLGAHIAGQQLQTDTYFHVPKGRLKLREIAGEPAVLIWYERPNTTDVRPSRYYLVPVAAPEQLQAALTAGLGLRGMIRKSRAILLWHNVRIHLDEVAGLGRFVEFEAVLAPNEDTAASSGRVEQLRIALQIRNADLIAASYADLCGL
jgi:predicted adenylyl cyclase CyaB